MKDNISKLKEMEELYKSWLTENLVRATTVEQRDYTPDAINLMRNELSKRDIPPQDLISTQASIEHVIEEEKNRFVGIKGFLLLFCVIVCLGSLGSLIAGISALVNGIPIIPLFPIFVGGYGLYTTFLLLRRKATAPRHARRLIFANFAIGILLELVILLNSNQIDPFALGFFGPLIWLEYLSRSKRVAATYGSTS